LTRNAVTHLAHHVVFQDAGVLHPRQSTLGSGVKSHMSAGKA